MHPSEIKKVEYFLGIAKAFQAVGRQLFAGEWRASPKLQQHRAALRVLQGALQSGKVTAYKEDETSYLSPLTTIDASGEFFRIDVSRNCIYLSNLPGSPFTCKVRGDELRKFVSAAYTSRPARTSSAQKQCTKWLVDKIKVDGTLAVRRILFPEAQKLFKGLGRDAFTAARGDACRQMNRPDLLKGGAPKGERPVKT